MRNSTGVEYTLAFPIGEGKYYSIQPGFPGTGEGQIHESAEGSGIYTEDDYATYLDNQPSKRRKRGAKALTVVK